MKRILEENQPQRTKIYCKECQTLFDYQYEDIETFDAEWDEKGKWQYPDKHYHRVTKFVTCPKCGKEYIITDRTISS